MRFIRHREPVPHPPATLILDLARPPCGWSSRDYGVDLEQRLCMLPGGVVEDRALCVAHRGDLHKARARRARLLAEVRARHARVLAEALAARAA